MFIVKYNIANVDYYSKSYSYQVYLRKNRRTTEKHLKVAGSFGLPESVLLNLLWQMLVLRSCVTKWQFFWSQSYGWYSWQVLTSPAYPILTSQCCKTIYFKIRDHSSKPLYYVTVSVVLHNKMCVFIIIYSPNTAYFYRGKCQLDCM